MPRTNQVCHQTITYDPLQASELLLYFCPLNQNLDCLLIIANQELCRGWKSGKRSFKVPKMTWYKCTIFSRSSLAHWDLFLSVGDLVNLDKDIIHTSINVPHQFLLGSLLIRFIVQQGLVLIFIIILYSSGQFLVRLCWRLSGPWYLHFLIVSRSQVSVCLKTIACLCYALHPFLKMFWPRVLA